jgi:hypothetical protein
MERTHLVKWLVCWSCAGLLPGVARTANAAEFALVADGRIAAITSGPGVDERKAPRLLLQGLRRRAPEAKPTEAGRPVVRFALTDLADVGPEGFRLAIQNGSLEVVARNDLGLVYAVGEILLRSHVTSQRISLELYLDPWLSRPICPVRGVWVDAIEGREYAAWGLDHWQAFLEELALWGDNTVAVSLRGAWGDPDSPTDVGTRGTLEEKAARWEKAGRVLELAHSLGLQTGAVIAANSAYAGRLDRQPVLRATPSASPPGALDSLACPSTTQGRLAILKTASGMIGRLPHLDYVLLTPFDDGGCWCAKCRERGWAEAYLDVAKRLREAAGQKHPDLKLMLTDWRFERQEAEWPKLLAAVPGEAGKGIDFFAATRPDEHGYDNAKPPRLALLEGAPVGAESFGALPLLRSLPAQWRAQLDAAPNYHGFLMRSAGIHDRLNVLAALRWHWSPRRTPEDLSRFLTAFYFGEEAVTQLAPAVLDMDHGVDEVDGKTTPFGRGGKTVEALLAEARERERTVRDFGQSLRPDLRNSEVFQSLLSRAAIEVRHWEAAK